MIFSRAAALFTMALPIFAAANELVARGSCDTGSLSCCATTQSTTATGLAEALAGAGLLGISISAILSDVTGLVGLGCSPITVIGGTGTSCTQQPVCCTSNYLSGLIASGCTPVNLNL